MENGEGKLGRRKRLRQKGEKVKESYEAKKERKEEEGKTDGKERRKEKRGMRYEGEAIRGRRVVGGRG